MARISGDDFLSKIGLPPILTAAKMRDYSIFVLMNTLDSSLNCPSCKAFDQEFAAVATQINIRDRLTKKVHFVTLEYRENQALFAKVILSLMKGDKFDI